VRPRPLIQINGGLPFDAKDLLSPANCAHCNGSGLPDAAGAIDRGRCYGRFARRLMLLEADEAGNRARVICVGGRGENCHGSV
jgi:hypothetical protein